VLVPLLRALVAVGFRYGDIIEAVDEALCAVAGERADPAAVRRLTGLPAARVHSARSRVAAADNLPLSYDAAVRIMAHWGSEPAFAQKGRPRALPLYGKRSFATLATMVGAEPESALAQLRRVGAVRVRGASVAPLECAYIPARGEREKLDILARDGSEFLRAILHNIKARPAGAFLQRKASYDNIGSRALSDLRDVLRREGQRALQRADATLAESDRDRNRDAPGGRRTRVSFGVYYVEEPLTASRPGNREKGGGG